MNRIILSIETTTNICSVSLFQNKKLIYLFEDSNRKHSSLLGLFVEKIFINSDIPIQSIDAIAISIGPGSYTGLRIGLSFAKGLAFSINKPIIPINTLDSLNEGIKDLNYFLVLHAYKDNFFIQEYKNGKQYGDTFFNTIESIKNKKIYGYKNNLLKNCINNISPCSKKIARIAYKNYDNYIENDIKLIKPNYIKPIEFNIK